MAPIPPMLKYSVGYNLLNFTPILIKIMLKFIVCKVLYSKAQYLLRLRSPLSLKCIIETVLSHWHTYVFFFFLLLFFSVHVSTPNGMKRKMENKDSKYMKRGISRPNALL